VKKIPQHPRHSPASGWLQAHQSAVLLTLVAIAAALRALLVIRSPTTFGYVYDFYHEGVQKFYALGRLPIAADCWQCYHPPLFYLLGLPLYALGKKMVAGPGGLADPALRFMGVLSIASGSIAAYYSYRLLRLFRIRGPELIVGTGLILAFPCLFISTYGLEADILLTALMTAFVYYAVIFFARSRPADYGGAVRIGLIAGLACETKYTGLLAPAILASLTGLGIAAGPQRQRLAREAAAALAVCALIGSWKYVDNFERYRMLLFANGSAQQGLAIAGRPSFARSYDFHSLRVADLVALTRGRVPPGQLTDLPFYRSVWTTLHAMAWGDMSFFSDPSRHGFRSKPPYPRKRLNPWLASSVLILGLVPDALAAIGFLVTIRRRILWPLAATGVITGAVYVVWFLAQESWALKTKYILFLLPAYVVYVLLGWRSVHRLAPAASRIVWLALVALVVAAHLYLLDFAWR
jgi:4-amino-4-deoxy-L-arabinose transferase-like glycosyltransferase